MKITAEISLFPFLEKQKGEIIKLFVDNIEKFDVFICFGIFSTIIEGELVEVFKAIEESYELVCSKYPDIDLLLEQRIINREKVKGGK